MNPNPEALTSLETLPARLYVEEGYLVAEYRGKTYRRQIPLPLTEEKIFPSVIQTIRSLEETGNGTEIDDLVERHFNSSRFNEWMDAVYEELKELGEMPLDEEYRD
jgi:hypothetical protein